jgi:hypothetical protein
MISQHDLGRLSGDDKRIAAYALDARGRVL